MEEMQEEGWIYKKLERVFKGSSVLGKARHIKTTYNVFLCEVHVFLVDFVRYKRGCIPHK